MPNEGKLILCALFACSPDGRMVLFRYYLLGSDTTALSGLYARLCHAFLVCLYHTTVVHVVALLSRCLYKQDEIGVYAF